MSLRRRLVLLYAGLAFGNLAAWAWAIAAFGSNTLLMGTALLAYGLGLRHAVDADHIVAIDNVTRKLMQEGTTPVSAGLFFSLGHSTVVLLACALMAYAVHASGAWAELVQSSAWFGTAVSSAFLLAIAAANAVLLFGLLRKGHACGAAHIHGGWLARAVRPLLALVTRSWHLYPLGVLFGLGFDVAGEVAVLGLSAGEAAKGLPLLTVLVFPALFTAAMAFADTLDGTLMIGVYGWALEDPSRKLRYNIAVTGFSVAMALLVGTLQAVQLFGERWAPQEAWVHALDALQQSPEWIGLGVASVFASLWLLALGLDRVRRPALTAGVASS